jgi:hypothetical protein
MTVRQAASQPAEWAVAQVKAVVINLWGLSEAILADSQG